MSSSARAPRADRDRRSWRRSAGPGLAYLLTLGAALVLGDRAVAVGNGLTHLRSQNCRGPWFEPATAYVLSWVGLAASGLAVAIAFWGLRSGRAGRPVAVPALVLGALVVVFFVLALISVYTDPWVPWNCP